MYVCRFVRHMLRNAESFLLFIASGISQELPIRYWTAKSERSLLIVRSSKKYTSPIKLNDRAALINDNNWHPCAYRMSKSYCKHQIASDFDYAVLKFGKIQFCSAESVFIGATIKYYYQLFPLISFVHFASFSKFNGWSCCSFEQLD